MLRYAEVAIGGFGASCRRCGGTSEDPCRASSEVLPEIAAAAPVAGGCVALTGGDAFARDDWRDLVRAAAAAGVTRLRLDVGTTLTDGAAAEAVACGVRHVRLCLAGQETGTVDAVAPVRAFASAAGKAGVAAVATTLVRVCRHNLQQLPGTVTEMARAGAASIVLRLADETMPLGPALPWLAAAADSGTVHRVWVSLENVPADALPSHTLHLTGPFALGEPA